VTFKGEASRISRAYVLSALYLAGQGAAIFVIYWYVQKIEADTSVTVPWLGYELGDRDEPILLVAVVVLSAVCFAASAVFLYISRRVMLTVVEQYLQRQFENLVWLVGRLPDPRAPIASKLAVRPGLTGLTMGCRRGALTAVSFSNLVPSLVGAVGGAWFLMFVDAPLTITILVAAALWATLLYPLTLRAVEFSRIRERAQIAFRNDVRLLHGAGFAKQPLTKLKSAAELVRGFIGRKRITTELGLASEIGVTIIVAMAIFYVGKQMMGGHSDWPIFIAYVGALRLTLAGCSTAVQAFAGVSRFYLQIVRYCLFMKDAQDIDKTSLATVKGGEDVILGSLPNRGKVQVPCGARLALATAASERELRLAFLDAKSAENRGPLGVTFLEEPDGITPSSTLLPIVVIKPDKLHMLDQPMLPFEDRQNNANIKLEEAVILISRRDPAEIGALGETHLLVVEDSEITAFAPVGTEDARKAIELFVRSIAKSKRAPAIADEDDEEEV
jgi:hypothetical protein